MAGLITGNLVCIGRGLFLSCAVLVLCACGRSPEVALASHWVEDNWSFEKLDTIAPSVRRFDGIRLQAFEHHTFFRHEAEYWHFRPNRTFEIALKNGSKHSGRWRLKGRGHVLTLRYATGETEMFDVKELDSHHLVLHAHLGMEVRGIARLVFSRDPSREAS